MRCKLFKDPYLVYISVSPVLEMREKPSFQSKVVSQALFGELLIVKERLGDWLFVQTSDRYFGWVPSDSAIEQNGKYEGDLEVRRLKAHLYRSPDVEYGPLFSLPFGSKLKSVDLADPRWAQVVLPDGTKGYIQKGDLIVEPLPFDSFCKQFLGLPYTWGGRSSFGFDCSGFSQMIYLTLGMALPRDAKDQARDERGKKIELEELREGDLLFWGHQRAGQIEIKHVAISLGGDEFIHTSSRENKPYLRISSLADPEWSGKGQAFYLYREARRYELRASFASTE